MTALAWLLLVFAIAGLAFWQWHWRQRWRERQRAAEERRARFIAEAMRSMKRDKT